MIVPTCSIHAIPMRKSSKGIGFYCAKKLSDGSWCKEKFANPPAATAEVPATASQASLGTTTNSDVLAVAALEFASKILSSGSTEEEIGAALLVAVKVYQTMKAIA